MIQGKEYTSPISTTTLRVPHLCKQPSLSLTSPTDLSEVLATPSSQESRSSISTTLEKRTGLESIRQSEVNKLTDVLQDARAEHRLKILRSSFSSNPRSNPSRITFDEVSEKMSEGEIVHSSEHFRNGQELLNIRSQYFCMLQDMIKKRLSKFNGQLSNSADEEGLTAHMRELRMMQMVGSRILFLDGGGLRGLIQIEILSQVKHR